MKSVLSIATDARQSSEWGAFLTQIGWQTTVINSVHIFYRRLPLFNRSLIKIQHPKGPLPLKKIDTFARKNRALFTIIEPHLEGFDKESLVKNNFQLSKLQFAHSATRLVDLRQSEQQLSESFSENARRNIRKAEKKCAITVTTLTKQNQKEVIDMFYHLYKELGKSRSFYVPSYHEVSSKILAFGKTAAFLFAYDRSSPSTEPVAVLWIGSIDHTLVYFHPGNTSRGYELLANYLLVWEAIRWGKKQKLHVFDFETAFDDRYPSENKQWKGYTEFKQKFGGELIEYPPSYIKFYNPIAKSIYTLGTMFGS